VALHLLAAYLRVAGAQDEALALLRKARRRHPGHFRINQDLADYLHWSRPYNVDEALRYSTAAVALHPERPGVQNTYGSILLDKGLVDEAIAAFQEVIRLNPDYEPGHYGLAEALKKHGDLPGAVAAMEALGNRLRDKGAQWAHHATAAFQRASTLKADLPGTATARKDQPASAPNGQAGKMADVARVPSPGIRLRTSGQRRDLTRALRAAALHPPYVYVLDRIGDLWTFQLPARADEQPGQELQEVGHFPAAGDGNALVVIGDTLLCSRFGSLEAFSLQDPAQPRYLGQFGPLRGQQTRALVRDHDRLIQIALGSLSVFDVSQPATPRHLGTTWTPGHGCNNGCVVGDRLYVGESHFAPMKPGRHGIVIYDLAYSGALKKIGFVEIPASPFHLLPVGKDRLAVLMDDRAQLFSTADPLRPAALGQPVATSARSGIVLPIDGKIYLVTECDVLRVEEGALIPVGGFRAGGTWDAAPYHGYSEGGYAAIALSYAVVVLRPEAGPAARLNPPVDRAHALARAVALAQQAVDANPKEGTFWNTLGVARYRAGDFKGAVEALDRSAELRQGGGPYDWLFLAMTHWQLGDKDEARKWYDRAVERMSMNEELWPVRAEAAALMGVGDTLPPFAEVRKAIDQAHALAGQGQWQKAAAEYARAGEAFSGDACLWLEYASALLLDDHTEGYRRASADIHRRLGAVTDPFTCYCLARIASLAPGGGDPAQAVQRAEKGVAAHPKQAWYLHTLAVAHYRAGQFDQAVRRAEQSLKDDPGWGGHVVDWLLLAMAHQSLGHGDEARHWLDKAVQWIDRPRGLPRESRFAALPVPSWCDRLEIQLLRREAEKLIGGQ
jgi:tetratricopeptide (TPR) repeat protein